MGVQPVNRLQHSNGRAVGKVVPRRASDEFQDESHHLAEAASAGAGRRHPGADPVSRRPADANAACAVATLLVGITGRMTSWEARSAVSAPPLLVDTGKALVAYGLPPADCLGRQGNPLQLFGRP
jgi:hypothetical protein